MTGTSAKMEPLAKQLVPNGWDIFCPEAKIPHPTRGGFAWWLRSEDPTEPLGPNALLEVKNSVLDVISEIPDGPIIVGGFSQGAALSLSMLFNTSLKFYGCIALSGYMPSAEFYKDSNIMRSKIFIAHGFSDQAISFEDYKKTYEFLCSKTKEIVSYTGDFGHTVTKDVSNKVSEWLSK